MYSEAFAGLIFLFVIFMIVNTLVANAGRSRRGGALRSGDPARESRPAGNPPKRSAQGGTASGAASSGAAVSGVPGQMSLPVDSMYQTPPSRNRAPEESGSGSIFEALVRGVKDPAVYSGGDPSSTLGDRLKKELQMQQHRQKMESHRAEEQRRMQADENARKEAEARARLAQRMEQMAAEKKKKEAAEREKSIGKARENATDSPETAAAHAHAAGGGPEGAAASPSYGHEIDISGCMDEVYQVMVCGPDTDIAFRRDFVGEGADMVSRALAGLRTA